MNFYKSFLTVLFVDDYFCIILMEESIWLQERRHMELKTTTLSKAIALVGEKAKCDEACKKVLAEKIILACIMKHTVGEFAEYEVSEIVHRFIDGDPVINKVPILPDETNAPKIPCTGVEDSSMNEGTVKFDIFFHVFLPDIYERVKMIINVEAQDNYYPGYPIVKRGIFYGCRMI